MPKRASSRSWSDALPSSRDANQGMTAGIGAVVAATRLTLETYMVGGGLAAHRLSALRQEFACVLVMFVLYLFLCWRLSQIAVFPRRAGAGRLRLENCIGVFVCALSLKADSVGETRTAVSGFEIVCPLNSLTLIRAVMADTVPDTRLLSAMSGLACGALRSLQKNLRGDVDLGQARSSS